MEHKWLMCDMHMHSEYSAQIKSGDKGKVKKMAASEYVEILKSYGVEIFSITDHNYFSAKYYEEINDYINDNSLKMRCIPGVEFDTYIDTVNNDEKYIHVCVYFKESVDFNLLEEKVNKLYGLPNSNKPKL